MQNNIYFKQLGPKIELLRLRDVKNSADLGPP